VSGCKKPGSAVGPGPKTGGLDFPGVIAISPDGTRLVFVVHSVDGVQRLATRLLAQSRVTPLAGTDDARTPFFSPNGDWIGLFADGKLKKISVQGGAPVTLCDAPGSIVYGE
jgi:serine/threonine-protein kinase